LLVLVVLGLLLKLGFSCWCGGAPKAAVKIGPFRAGLVVLLGLLLELEFSCWYPGGLRLRLEIEAFCLVFICYAKFPDFDFDPNLADVRVRGMMIL
jgi:hypothetical protein